MRAAQSLVPSNVASQATSHGRPPVAFAPRFFVLLLVGLVWIVPAWWSPELIGAMFLWDAMAIVLWGIDLWRLPKPGDLRVERVWTEAPSFATPSEVKLVVQVRGSAGVRVWATDETPPALCDAPPEVAMTIAAPGQGEGAYWIRPRSRGDHRLGRVFLKYRSALGIAERWTAADVSQTVRVLPDLAQARDQSLYLIRSRQIDLEKRRKRQRGLGREFEALREYRQGDELRDVCWTATARRHQLIARTYQVERSQTVWVVMDAGRMMRARVRDSVRGMSVAKLDYAVDAALALAQVAAQSGDRVGLVAYGRTIQRSVGTGRGARHIRTLVDALAQVRAEAPEADHALAVRTLLKAQSRRSLIVWITDFAETATAPEVIQQAAQMTRHHLVIFAAMTQPDLIELTRRVPQNAEDMFRYTAALEIAQRRERLLAGLRRQGVLTLDIVPGELTQAMINEYLEVKDRSLL